MQYRALVSIETSSTANAVPLPHKARLRTSYKEKALTPHCVGIVVSNISASEALPYCRTMGGCSLSRAPAGRSPSPAGVGWRGLPLRIFKGADSGFRRTIGIYPRLRVSAGLNFAVILLSKAMDVGRDHLIHRKRSPFPYEGKDLTPLK